MNKPVISVNNIHKVSKSNYNSSKKKRKYNFKIPSLIEEYKNDKFLTEPNNKYFELKKINIHNSQKNTFFTSKENKSIITPKKESKAPYPFFIEKKL